MNQEQAIDRVRSILRGIDRVESTNGAWFTNYSKANYDRGRLD